MRSWFRRRFRVDATLAGQRVSTKVDSALAKYYLEHYLQGRRTSPRLDAIIDEVHRTGPAVPDRAFLERLSGELSTDFASIYLAARLLNEPRHQAFGGLFERELNAVRASTAAGADPVANLSRAYTFLFVPGWVYRSVKTTGADFARPRQILARSGVDNRLVEIPECGTIERSADVVAETVARVNQERRPIVLVSASSGGASTALALATLLRPADRSHVGAWVNAGGLLHGSFAADRAILWPRRWSTKAIIRVRRWEYASVLSMTTAAGRARAARCRIPEDLFCVNYIGIPLSGDVTRRARGAYRYARPRGPNDGLTLITDALVPHGVTVAVLGPDHYHADAEGDLRSIALARAVVATLERRASTSDDHVRGGRGM